MNVCVMDSPELKELYNSVKDTGESYESIKNLVNVWQLRKFNRNKNFDFTELPTKQDIENLLKERDVPNIDSTFMQEYTQEMKDILANAPRDEQGRLLAPNGKPSNLTERQYAQVRTKAFKEWFGDWEKLYRYNLSVSEINDLFDNKYNALSIEDFINRSLTYYENERKEIEDRSHEYPHLVERQRRDNDIYKNSILLLKDLISHIDTSNLKVQKQNFIKYQKAHNIDITKDIGGVYYSATNHIFFSNYGAPSSRTIYAAHEIIHAVTYNEYNNNEQFKKEVDSLYEYIKNISPNNKLYGLSSPTEMLAEVVNPDFQKFLLTIPSRKNNKSILQEIIDYIKDCFNIKGKRTALEDIIDLIKENARVITFNPNSVSKVVDENGEPLIVYHESPNVFNTFDISKKRFNVHNVNGIWASAINRKGEGYGENIYPLFINLRNPINTSIKQVKTIIELRDLENKALNDVNSDGVILDTIDKFGHEIQYYVKSPNQVKSATDNIGTFSTEDNRIDRFDTILNENNKLTEEQKQFILNSLPNLDTFIEDIYSVS